MLRIVFLAAAAVALCACGRSKTPDAAAAAAPVGVEEAVPDEDRADAVIAARLAVDENAAHPALSPAQKIGGAEGRSPFVGDRVVMLNEIVRRSLEASREYDKLRPQIRAAVAAAAGGGDRAAAEDGLEKISELYDSARRAFDDMTKAEAELKASGEYYDDAIFYGMTKFVSDIETELREEKAALAAALAG